MGGHLATYLFMSASVLDAMLVKPPMHNFPRIQKNLSDLFELRGIRTGGQTFHPGLRALDERQHVGRTCRREKLLAGDTNVDGRRVGGNMEIPVGDRAVVRNASRRNPSRPRYVNLLIEGYFRCAFGYLPRSHHMAIQNYLNAVHRDKALGLTVNFDGPPTRADGDLFAGHSPVSLEK